MHHESLVPWWIFQTFSVLLTHPHPLMALSLAFFFMLEIIFFPQYSQSSVPSLTVFLKGNNLFFPLLFCSLSIPCFSSPNPFISKLLPTVLCEQYSFLQDFPGGPVVKTPHFHCRGHGFNPWQGSQDPACFVAKKKKKKKKTTSYRLVNPTATKNFTLGLSNPEKLVSIKLKSSSSPPSTSYHTLLWLWHHHTSHAT